MSHYNYFYTYVIPFLLFTILLIKWLRKPFSANRKRLPPSPPSLPILGNLHQLGEDPPVALKSLAKTYGPLMMIRLGRLPVLIASSADAAREIMKTHDTIFSNRPIFPSDEKILVGSKGFSMAPYGEYWRQMRSICALHLLSNKTVQSFKPLREEETALFIEKINKSSLLTLPVDLTQTLATLTNDFVCRVAFGRKYGDDGEQNFKEVLDECMLLLGGWDIGNFIPWLAWISHLNGLNSRYNRVAKWLDNFLDKVIDEHIDDRRRLGGSSGSEVNNKDLVDVLLEIQKNDTISGFSLERESMKGSILDIFIGGSDTTTTVLEWSMTELLRHPKVMKQVQDEVRQIGIGKSSIKEEDLDKMHYLKAVIKETLRLYPPVPLLVPRLSSHDVKIMGYDIPAGTTVLTNAWAIGRDPATWDEPDEFRPERFLNSPIDFKGNDFRAIPFGAGRRSCPGLSFAMAMSEIVLANLVYKFDWSLPGGVTGQDLDMTQSSGLIGRRKVHLKAVATSPTVY
ncbi:Cytochrome P450 [Corchorus capsularis]|uniref:Cytochrome P450 n=1 Tax=Corchorus capsularis TaxID=210143 RepID=A0A1R3HPE1_COCAP|nr:Cytochrome P450 [Corchorus capsularis]